MQLLLPQLQSFRTNLLAMCVVVTASSSLSALRAKQRPRPCVGLIRPPPPKEFPKLTFICSGNALLVLHSLRNINNCSNTHPLLGLRRRRRAASTSSTHTPNQTAFYTRVCATSPSLSPPPTRMGKKWCRPKKRGATKTTNLPLPPTAPPFSALSSALLFRPPALPPLHYFPHCKVLVHCGVSHHRHNVCTTQQLSRRGGEEKGIIEFPPPLSVAFGGRDDGKKGKGGGGRMLYAALLHFCLSLLSVANDDVEIGN